MKRRQERSGHRLRARLRTLRLVRPGAAAGKDVDGCPPLEGVECAPGAVRIVGGTAEGLPFVPCMG